MTPAPDALAAVACAIYRAANDSADDYEEFCSERMANAAAVAAIAAMPPSPELRRATEDARVLRAALEHARYIRDGFERFMRDTGPWHALARIDGYQTVVDGLDAIDAALAQKETGGE